MTLLHRLVLAVPAILALSACGAAGPTGAFSPQFPDNERVPTERIARALQSSAASASTATEPVLAATTTAEPRQLALYDMSTGRQRWTVPLEALTRPEILGDVVVTSTRENVVGLDVQTGAELWRSSLEGPEEGILLAYVGASREGNTIVFVASTGASGGATRFAHIAAIEARSGAIRWEHELTGVLGQPTASGGVVFVPWERQNIAILGLTDGIEQARLRSTDDVIAWVDETAGRVYYGSLGIYRFGAESYHGTKLESVYVSPPIEGVPGSPLVHDDGFLPKPGMRSARGKVRVYFTPIAESDAPGIRVAGDRYYYTYYKYVFAFDSARTLRWARLLERDIIGGEALADGLLTVSESGSVHVLDANTGNDRWTGELHANLASVDVRAEGFAPGGQAGQPRELRTSLIEIAGDVDNRLVPARAFAVQQITRLAEPAITRDLLDIYALRTTPGGVREAIAEALKTRATGTEYLVEALGRHYDYLEGAPVPPLEAIVPALVTNRVTSAVPALLQHLLDHETPRDALPGLIRAIAELGDASVLRALQSFLELYRADSTFRGNPDAARPPGSAAANDPRAVSVGQERNAEAITAAAEAILARGGAETRAQLAALALRPETNPVVGIAVREQIEAERQRTETAAREQEQAAERAREQAARTEVAARPLRLGQQAINDAFSPHVDAIRACVAEELTRTPELAQIRIAFVANNDGTAQDFSFVPNGAELVACLTPAVAQVQLPLFRERRQRASFRISLRSATATLEVTPDAGPQPWWVRLRARVPDANPSEGRPWWIPRAAADVARPPAPQQQPAARPGAPAPDAGDAWWEPVGT